MVVAECLNREQFSVIASSLFSLVHALWVIVFGSWVLVCEAFGASSTWKQFITSDNSNADKFLLQCSSVYFLIDSLVLLASWLRSGVRPGVREAGLLLHHVVCAAGLAVPVFLG